MIQAGVPTLCLIKILFPGLKPVDGWCLCALLCKEAYEAGGAPVKPEATHEKALESRDHR